MPPLSRPSNRTSGRTILAHVVALALVLGACAPVGGPGGAASSAPSGTGSAAPAATPSGTSAASPRAIPTDSTSACETGTFPGWPTPGKVTTSGIIPVLASSEKVVGRSRLLFTLVDDKAREIANEALQLQVAFFDLCVDPATPTETLAPAFAWGIVGERAFYIVTPELSRAGPWGALVTIRDPAAGTRAEARLQFTVAEQSPGPRVGDPAPSVATLTLADVGGDVGHISSDPSPEPSFYETSIPAALAAKEPFLLAFATPAFCESRQCGPTLNVVKAAVKVAPIRVVAVEPYELAWADGRLQPVVSEGGFVPVEATSVYAIPTEPWLFLVDASGTIAGAYEAVVGEQELIDAIRAVTK